MIAELVRQARSYRRFMESDRIPAALLRELVDIARLVPSAGNQQLLRYRLVSDPQQCAAVFTHLKWAGLLKEWGGPKEGERPTGYVVILAAVGKSPAVDIGIAAQTIQLAASERRYGACMLGAIDRPGLHATLGLSPDVEVQLVIALGRPGETIVLEDAHGSTAYWRSADQVHHVPKRTLDEVLL